MKLYLIKQWFRVCNCYIIWFYFSEHRSCLPVRIRKWWQWLLDDTTWRPLVLQNLISPKLTALPHWEQSPSTYHRPQHREQLWLIPYKWMDDVKADIQGGQLRCPLGGTWTGQCLKKTVGRKLNGILGSGPRAACFVAISFSSANVSAENVSIYHLISFWSICWPLLSASC